MSYLAPNSFVHAADYHLQGGPSGFGPEIELQCISDNVKLLGIGNNTIPVPEIYTTKNYNACISIQMDHYRADGVNGPQEMERN